MSAVLLSILSVISVLSASWAELRVTMEGFESRGTFAERLRSTTTIRSSEVRWIEYQDDTTGPETAHHPGGLYAVTIRRNVCILPYVDEKETATVIELIERKFPQFTKNWEKSGPFGGHFTTLKLDD